MQWLASICVKRPGLRDGPDPDDRRRRHRSATSKLNVDRFPNVDFPIVTVVTVLPGAAPEQIETEVTDKIEEAVNTISGLEELQSISTEGVSQLIVRFNLDKDVNVAAQEVRDQVSTALPNLPEGTKNPVISKLDPGRGAGAVRRAAVEAPDPRRDRVRRPRGPRRRWRTSQGVGQVTILGGRKRQIQVVLDPVQVAGGRADRRRRAARHRGPERHHAGWRRRHRPAAADVPGERARRRRVTAVGEIIVRAVEGHPIPIARRRHGRRRRGGGRDRRQHRRQAGGRAVDPQAVGREQRRRRRRAQRAHEGVRAARCRRATSCSVIRDNTETTRTSVDAVKEHLGLGAVLASLVVLLFLGNLRSTIIAALAIPTSIIGTFMCMWLMGFTLNTITLLALALAVGIVIDDAIVVLENIFRFIEEKRIRPMPAAIYATKEIGLPVLATTLSLLAVFLPVAFMNVHPGAVPAQLRPDHGRRDRDLAAGQLHADADAGVALAAACHPPGERRKNDPRAVHRRVLPADRARLHGDARGSRSTTAGSWCWRRSATLVSMRAADQGGAQGLPAQERRGAVPDRRAHAGGDQPGRDADRRRAHRARGAAVARGARRRCSSIGDNQQKTPNLASIFVRLVPPDARTASQDELQNRVAPARSCPSCPRTTAPASRWWRRSAAGSFSTATVQYILNGPDREARPVLRPDRRQAEERSRARSTSTPRS